MILTLDLVRRRNPVGATGHRAGDTTLLLPNMFRQRFLY